MNDRLDKFTERAKKVLVYAQDEATRFNHNYIGTEHLLLGLVREGEGIAAQVLKNLGVELNKVRSAVEFIIGRGERMVVGDITLTPRAKRVIELSIEEARRLGHNYIGTEHLLLGLVREGEGIAAGVLESLGRQPGEGALAGCAGRQPEPERAPARGGHHCSVQAFVQDAGRGPDGHRPHGGGASRQAGPGDRAARRSRAR